MPDYRVNLDVYNGPLDLLLYLIRRDEVDIYDIPITRVTEQYLRYVEMLKGLDPNLAGEFLVLAATLMEIKTRMLLPSPPPEEGGETGLVLDPRTELVKQLLQYKAFKDAAGELREAGDEQAMKFSRPAPEGEAAAAEVNLEDVQVWDLMEAFGKLMEAIGHRPTHHEVVYDDTPIELYVTDILDRLQREGTMTFAKIFEGRSRRLEILGLFLALLEVIRQKKARAMQDANFGQIVIVPRKPPLEAEAAGEAPAAESPAAPSAPTTPSTKVPTQAPPAEDGQYIHERTDGPEEEMDNVG
ncbi:MAG: segregation/condensation protein A [Phycisphaerae bacterium]|jgi:segregation and condensation protein A